MTDSLISTPAGILAIEHRWIESMVSVMSIRLSRMKRRRCPDTAFIDDAARFLADYADSCHHGKEEDIFFKKLLRKRLDRRGRQLIYELIREHRNGRRLVKALRSAKADYEHGRKKAVGPIKRSMASLIELYTAHIDKEDHTFPRLCMDYMSKKERDRMMLRFFEADSGFDHDRYTGMVERLQ